MSNSDIDTSFLYGVNSSFITELYLQYLRNPQSVNPSWQSFFKELGDDISTVIGNNKGPSWSSNTSSLPKQTLPSSSLPFSDKISTADYLQIEHAAHDSLRALMFIRAYRVRGHLEANLDPLNLKPYESHPELNPVTYGFNAEDMNRPIFIGHALGLERATFGQIVKRVREIYCGDVGVEYMHIQDPAQKYWIQERIEQENRWGYLTAEDKKNILTQLTIAEIFEHFLDKRYTATKRFGLDGGESLIVALDTILRKASKLGLREIVLGMAHRGRLNVLANVLGKSFAAIFSEFQGNDINPEDVQGSADVKYHLGTSSDRVIEGRSMHLSLTANPSHLEAVNTVVLGKVRAKQKQYNDTERAEIMPILLHGDAAFAGQGLVAETLDISDLRGYRVGGTIHLIVNNQIGFTTNPVNLRSGPYCSEVAKIVQAPIFHVNGDNPEAVAYVSTLAMEFRQQFKKDVIVDIFCYRRFGHNETDEPAFTQPLMYKKIAAHSSTRAIYTKKLIDNKTLTEEAAQKIVDDFQRILETEYQSATLYKPDKADWLQGMWQGLKIATACDRKGNTAVDMKTLKEIGKNLTNLPPSFKANSKIIRQLSTKRAAFDKDTAIDWATGEALAFGTLLAEGYGVRLSGQDCGRGTFSQRHAVLIDQETEEPYIPLNNVKAGQKILEIVDSPLSEAGILGFEYGYSLADPNTLVLWEAQFGDFANGAQVIIDQFISSGEAKWLRMSGLVMLLPHGYEGQGPEHSSARLERYLQLCAEDNMQVVNCTTPASYFHVLRRQIHRNFRKPLIIMTPKSLLRHKLCVSSLKDMAEGTCFQRVLKDDDVFYKGLGKKIILCSGKIYYDLYEERAKQKNKDILILRMEQLYPFPDDALLDELKLFPKAEIIWCQEEPKNM
ncbi:MAG: 2-oxoglutarate dehydrogenase E1 component, partial [Alphaproteobacteria bacterium]|nr:2-oxoglutarate dehydrogenase E1 component [Alphaproteobacteria bacterium]